MIAGRVGSRLRDGLGRAPPSGWPWRPRWRLPEPGPAACSAGRPVARRRADPGDRPPADAAAAAAGARARRRDAAAGRGPAGAACATPRSPAATSRSASVRDLDAAGLPARLYVPTGRPATGPLLVFLHGGGFMLRRPRQPRRRPAGSSPSRLRRPGAGGRLPARRPSTRSRRRTTTRWRRTAWAVEHAAELGADPAPARGRRRLGGRQPGGGRGDRGRAAAAGRARCSCWSTRRRDVAAADPERRAVRDRVLPDQGLHGPGRRELRGVRRRPRRPAALPAGRRAAGRAGARAGVHRRLRPAARRGRGVRASGSPTPASRSS